MTRHAPKSKPVSMPRKSLAADPADNNERRSIESLIPYANNARTHTDEQIAQIAASMNEWGWTNPVLIDETGMIIAGHGRVLAARKLGRKDIPVVIADGWTDAQKKAYVLADNQLALNAGWNPELLTTELQGLDELGFDLELLGFPDLASLMIDGTEGLTDPDDVPDAPDEPVTWLGDVWLLGNHRLVCGDSTEAGSVEASLDGNLAQAVFTSAPYAVGLSYDGYEDTIENLRALLDDILPMIDIALLPGGFCTLNFGDVVSGKKIVGSDEVCEYPMAMEYWPRGRKMGWYLHTRRIWVKPIGATVCPWTASSSRGSTEWEHLWTWKKPGPDRSRRTPVSQFGVWHYSKFDYETNVLEKHPGAFPVYIVEAGLDFYSSQGDTVFEPFLGSGTTMIACERLNRRCAAIEISPAYVDVAIERWQNFTGKDAVYDTDGKQKTFAQMKESRRDFGTIKDVADQAQANA